MKKKALALAITGYLAFATTGFAAVNYDGGKLSDSNGPNFIPDKAALSGTTSSTINADVGSTHLQDEPSLKNKKTTAVTGKKGKNKEAQVAPAQNTLPITLYGDQVVYHNDTGDFTAQGRVRIYQGTQQLFTTQVEGNMKTGDVYLNKGGTLLDGKTKNTSQWAHYNFNNKTGKLKDMNGTSGNELYTAEEGEIYPDRIVLNSGGSTSSCPAVDHTKCLEVKANKVVIFPNDRLIAYGVKVFVKGKHIYSRDRWINDLTKEKNTQSLVPHIGHSSKHGWEITYNYEQPLSDTNQFTANLKYYSKIGWRPEFSDRQDARNFYVAIKNGFEEDDDNNWVKKERDVTFGYKSHKFTNKLPLSYSGYASHGLWSNAGYVSWHSEAGVFINHDRISFGDTHPLNLDMGVGHKWTHESFTDKTDKTLLYSVTLSKAFDPGWNTYVGYYWQKLYNPVFAFNTPSMARELQVGLIKRFDALNNGSYILRYDEGLHKVYEHIFRYTHDFCCWRVMLEYRKKVYNNTNEWSVNYDLYRW